MQGLGCRLLADQRIPVADDISLSADVSAIKRPGPLVGDRPVRRLEPRAAHGRHRDRQQ
jgi:hypothetical protein